MANNFLSADVGCPFYHDYVSHELRCEGVKDNSSIHLAFGSPTDRRDYMHEYCYTNYKNCKVARMLYEKYEKV